VGGVHIGRRSGSDLGEFQVRYSLVGRIAAHDRQVTDAEMLHFPDHGEDEVAPGAEVAEEGRLAPPSPPPE
jgi:hypothetical protein